MQLLCHHDVKDFTAWRKVFDDDAENRRAAGLTLLQLWHQHENDRRVFCLFKVNDLDKARAFLDDPRAQQLANKAGVTSSDYYVLDTA